MAEYEFITYRIEENLAFTAEALELVGCGPDRTTYRKALANVEVVVQERNETTKELKRPVVEPTARPLPQACSKSSSLYRF